MKRTFLTALTMTILLAGSCTETQKLNKSNTKIEIIDAKPINSDLADLAAYTGRYPNEVALLKNVKLKPRLQQLLGKDYELMVKYWNTETPISVENNIISTTGCEQHNCANNDYTLSIDLPNDKISVFHTKNGKVKKYAEQNKALVNITP
jgi:hypothetical protein